MQSLKTIKKRITSVKNTQKITKAMKMVAAAKLRRAQQAALNSRAYLQALTTVTGRVVAGQKEDPHPLTRGKEKISSKEFLVLTSDRGLCGGFNSNLLRSLEAELSRCRSAGITTEIRMIGKKGSDYFKAKKLPLGESLKAPIAEELAAGAVQRFLLGRSHEIWMVFNYFKSTLVQEVTYQKLLPIHPSPIKEGEHPLDYLFEPTSQEVLAELLRECLVAQIYSGLLESVASELASRMQAMENATNNAKDMIGYLTLVYNRARQATITKDLMDIVNGAEALR